MKIYISIILLLFSVVAQAQTKAGFSRLKFDSLSIVPETVSGDPDFIRVDSNWVKLFTGSGGGGTVTSFGSGNLSPLFSTSVATATTTPALSFTQISQLQNLVFASPNGSSGDPAFRALVAADIPPLNYQSPITTGTTAQYFRGDLSLATFPTALSSFTNDVPFATASNAMAFTNKTGNISMWTNDAGYLTSTGITPAALTKADDANVTLTLGGTPSTALLQATSLTLGWAGQLSIARGGTGLGSLGTALQQLRVNAGATALEYFTPSAGGGESLAATLAIGNTTSGNNIVLSDGDFIGGSGFVNRIDFGADDQIWLTTDGGTGATPSLYLDNATGVLGMTGRTMAVTSGAITLTHPTTIAINSGSVTMSDLTGVGSRMVTADATGTLGAMTLGTANQLLRVNAGATAMEYFTSSFLTAEVDPLSLKILNNLSDLNNAATARTNLGGTTIGSNYFTLTNPSAITFPRQNADNTISSRTAAELKTDLSLNNVENTALSTWVGSTNLTTLGTIATGVWNGTAIANANLANSTISGIALGSNLADLTAGDATLAMSGAYNGGTARTIRLDLSIANTWLIDQSVPDEVYGIGWDGSFEIPTKNALYDKIETIGGGPQTPWTSDINADGFILNGNDGSGETMTIRSTSHATKGFTYIGSSTILSVDEVNSRVGIKSATPTTTVDIIEDGLGTAYAATKGLTLRNTTAAAAGVQQGAPFLKLIGQGWKTNATAASQSVAFQFGVLPIQAAAAPTGELRIFSEINSSGSLSQVFSVSSVGAGVFAGALAITGALTGATTGAFSSTLSSTVFAASTQLKSVGTATVSASTYRTTNGGGNVTPVIILGEAATTPAAGVLSLVYDQTNQLAFNAGNGSVRVSRAGAQITNLDNTAGSEDADLIFLTQAAGAAMTEKVRIANTGGVTATSFIKSTNATAGIGYATGAGGTVTQATSKATGVTLNTICGTITMNNALLLPLGMVTFTVTNSACAATDVIHIQHDSGGTLGAYIITPNTPGAGTFNITVTNITAGSLSEAVVLRFTIIKAVIN